MREYQVRCKLPTLMGTHLPGHWRRGLWRVQIRVPVVSLLVQPPCAGSYKPRLSLVDIIVAQTVVLAQQHGAMSECVQEKY